MTKRRNENLARILGGMIALLILICMWAACGKYLIEALNGNERPNYHNRSKTQ